MVGNPDFLTNEGQEIEPADIQELDTPEGELHLRFYLPSGKEFALPAVGIKEVIAQPIDRVTPIPNASPLLLGTINLRGQIIWVADLGQFLGDSMILNTERPEIMVIAVEDQESILGLAIDKINCMDWLDVENTQVVRNFPDSMTPFIRGEWLLDEESELALSEVEVQVLGLLDQVAILRSARWAA